MEKSPRSSLPLLVLVALVALLVGSVGTAVAGPALTKGKVKKLAAQVVKKKAGSLTVASAGNAANLGGQPPAAYLDQTWTYAVPTGPDSAVKNFAVSGLPGGSYLVVYQVALQNDVPASCWVQLPGGSPVRGLLGHALGSAGGTPTVISGSGLVSLGAGAVPRLACETDAGGTLQVNASEAYPSSITFTRISQLATGTAPAVPAS